MKISASNVFLKVYLYAANPYLFSSRFGYAKGVCNKSMAISSVHLFFICYFSTATSDYFFQRKEMSAQILAEGLHFAVLL